MIVHSPQSPGSNQAFGGTQDIVQDIHRHERFRRLVIWGLVALVALMQAAAWLWSGVPHPIVIFQVAASWVVTLVLAVLASRRIGRLTDRLSEREHAHRAMQDEVEQLQTQNAMLQIVARSVDVPLTFQALAVRIARLVPCDRVGLAVLSENGQEFETSTARVHEDERRVRPRPDVVFRVDRTAIGSVVRAGEPLLVTDMKQAASEFLDVNVLYTAGFKSALVMPLISRGRGVGTLNVVSRADDAFTSDHVEVLRPIAEILAVAHVAQQTHMLLGKYRTIEAMSEVMLSVATEINSALQTIVGTSTILERTPLTPPIEDDLATIKYQAQRIAALLEKMRVAAHDRLQEVAITIEETGIPTSPEAYEHEPVV